MNYPPPYAPLPPPVPSRLSQVLFAIGLSFVLTGTIISVVFTLVGGPVWDDWILDSRGVAVLSLPSRIDATSSRVNKARVYEATVTFPDRGTLRQVSVRSHKINPGQVGQPLPIEYDPESYTRCRLQGGQSSFFGNFVLIPFSLALLGGVFALGSVAARRRG